MCSSADESVSLSCSLFVSIMSINDAGERMKCCFVCSFRLNLFAKTQRTAVDGNFLVGLVPSLLVLSAGHGVMKQEHKSDFQGSLKQA